MNQTDTHVIKTVFGLKMKQFRQAKNYSLQDLALETGVSKSYLNEIETGKKYPKHDKILLLAAALDCTYDDLVSTKVDETLAPLTELLQSDVFREIPLDLFGINKSNLVTMISDAPVKVTAFINTLIEIAKNYNLGKERFYFAMLRSFQELHNNYFPEIEEKAERFSTDFISEKNVSYAVFETLLSEQFGYTIATEDLKQYGASGKLRSLFIPEKKLLLLNELLDENQKLFILAKETAFNVLQLSPRPNTYSWLDFSSFEELLNNHYASYFAGCLLISRSAFKQDVQTFFQMKTWNPQGFEALISKYTNSPETFYYRLTNILPSEFGLKDLFYLCFTKKKDSDKIEILKELHLNQQQSPHANATNEHYCRRWIATKNLCGILENETLTGAQISHYHDSGLSYLVISTSQKNPFSDGTNRSYCIGILLTKESAAKLKFAQKKPIEKVQVGVTCEHCAIENCEVRQAPATRLARETFNENMKNSVQHIREKFLK